MARSGPDPRSPPAGPLARARCRVGGLVLLLGALPFPFAMAYAIGRYGPPSYRLTGDSISDLQAVRCGDFEGHFVCSPASPVADAAVLLAGSALVAGLLLARPAFVRLATDPRGWWLLLIAGGAAVANAFTPEDLTAIGDDVTAITLFLAASFGLLLIRHALAHAGPWRALGGLSRLLGVTGLGALLLWSLGLTGPLGEGGMEWVISAPVLVWMVSFGALVLVRDPGAPAPPGVEVG